MATYTYATLNDPLGVSPFGTVFYGINDAGQIVGDYWDGNVAHGFLYSAGVYTTLNDPLGAPTFALGINNGGQVVGKYIDNSGAHIFLYSAGTYTTLNDPYGVGGSLGTNGLGINDLGQVVGSYIDSSGVRHGFLYSGGSYTTLNDPFAGAIGTEANGINDAGQIVGDYWDSNNNLHGFLYSDGVYTTLNATNAYDINASGQIVGVSFLYDGATYSTLTDPLGTAGTVPLGINSTGQIVGYYIDSNGQHGFLASPTTNHAPIASNVSGNANEDTNILPVTLTASYTDADLSDTFTFADDETGTLGLVTNNHDGTFTYNPNGKFEYLGVGETASDTFKYTVTDNDGASSTATATVTIHGENDLPVALPDLAVTQKGTTIAIDAAHGVLANDTDPDIHDVLRVVAVNGSSANVGHSIVGVYGTLTLATDGSYSYVANNNLGSAANTGAVDNFNYTVDDGHAGTSTSHLSINVLPAQASSPQHTPPTQTLTELINQAEQAITNQENTSGFLFPSHLTDNFHLVDDIANAVAAQFGTPQNQYVIGSTSGNVNDGFINLKSELSNPNDAQFLDQCVALVQSLDKKAGLTSTWHPSTQVDVNGQIANIAAGSPIATFKGQNYDTDHAAIFLGAGVEKGVSGFFVLDQYNNPAGAPLPAGTHLDVNLYEPAEIRFISTSDTAATHYFLLA